MYVTCRLIDRELQAQRGRRRPCNGKMSKNLGARRPCSCKRTRSCKGTRRVAPRMAAPPAAVDDRSLFISTGDCHHQACLVYGVRLEPVAPPSYATGGSGGPPPAMMEILRPSADPVVRWSEEEHRYSALAAASGGAAILALIAGSRRTVVHDVATGTDTPGPRLRRSKRDPALLPVGSDTVLVMDTAARPGRCCFEALRRVPGGGWRAEALPDPPVAFPDLPAELPSSFHSLHVSAYFAMGSRAWISLSRTGTLSLDTERGTWQMEGTWELPLDGRGLFVPELGGVVIGITSAMHFEPDTERCCQVCALDVDVEGGRRPPAVRHVWEIPPEERVQGVAPSYETADLAHLGNGRFCISRSFVVDGRTAEGWSCKKTGTSFTLVDVRRLPGGDLELAKHGNAYCHAWPWGHIGHTTFLQPA